MKKNRLIIIISLIVSALIIFNATYLLVEVSTLEEWRKTLTFVLMLVFVLIGFIFAWTLHVTVKRRRETIKKSFDYYIEEMVAATGIGLLSYSSQGDIIWSSKFIEERFKRKLIGNKLSTISNEFYEKYMNGESSFRFTLDGIIYEANINSQNKSIVLKDVTIEETLVHEYRNQRLVIMELEIDNFQQLQSSLAEDELFSVQSVIIRSLDKLTMEKNAFYRQYANGKYIIITSESVLNELVNSNFNILDDIRGKATVRERIITVSIGVGAGTPKLRELLNLAKDGLVQSQSRGGDQVALMKANFKPEYFGSTTEISKSTSRVRIKQLTDSIYNVIKKSSIKKIIIYGHIMADLDAIGAALGIYELLKVFPKKEIYIQNKILDNTTKKAVDEMLDEDLKEIFISTAKAQKLTDKSTAVFMVDTADITRIENPKAFDNANKKYCFVIDHHRSSELPKEIPQLNIYVDTSASSTCEIVTEMLSFSQHVYKPARTSVQMLLNGIYLDTQQFRKHVSSRTFDAAAWLESHGAKSNLSAARLKIPASAMKLISQILMNVKEIKKGFFLSTLDEVVEGDVISMGADEILRAQGRVASFVIAKNPDGKSYKLSARGLAINVQQIAAQVGGGGHFEAAAAVSTEPLSVFTDNVIQAIISHKGTHESNNN